MKEGRGASDAGSVRKAAQTPRDMAAAEDSWNRAKKRDKTAAPHAHSTNEVHDHLRRRSDRRQKEVASTVDTAGGTLKLSVGK